MGINKLAILGLSVAFAVGAQAGTITWTGNTDTDWATGTNWDGNVAPANNDYGDIARFAETSPANKTPNVAGGRSVNKVFFDNSTGWSITGVTLLFKDLESTGAGVNTLNNVKIQGSNHTWSIGADNTVIINTLVQDSASTQLKLVGGGILQVGGQIGYSYSGSKIVKLEDITLRVASSTVYSNATSSTHFTTADGVLELLTTVANAQAQITNGKIVDDTALGLGVTDIGGGYVRISVIPEPATMALFASGLGLIGLRRRGRRD